MNDAREPSDPHIPPLDDEDDTRWLKPDDPRRVEIERRKRDAETGMDSFA